jgi:hypothetical protein
MFELYSSVVEKIEVDRIRLVREEGAFPSNASVFSFDAADTVLRNWALTAPNVTEGGYHKCSIQLQFEDGFVYTAHYDLTNSTSLTPLKKHLRSHCMYLTGQRKPQGVKPKQYEAILERLDVDTVETAKMILSDYDI